MFYQYYAGFILRSDIVNKKVFYIKNKLFNDHEIYNNKALWINPKKNYFHPPILRNSCIGGF